MATLFEQNPYTQQQNFYAPDSAAQGSTSGSQSHLQFYSSGTGGDASAYNYGGSAGELEGTLGDCSDGPSGQIQGGFWAAFTPSGYADEPPLLQELGINFDHIQQKSLAALNPLKAPDQNIMDDADLAGPLFFGFCFGMFLLFSGRPQFGYIYGVGLLGVLSIYFLLNLMSPHGIPFTRVASVLGYCLLPLVLMSLLSVGLVMDGILGYLIASITIFWCSYSASGIFTTVLQMTQQRVLVAYPVGLFYASFALLTMFKQLKVNASAV